MTNRLDIKFCQGLFLKKTGNGSDELYMSPFSPLPVFIFKMMYFFVDNIAILRYCAFTYLR